MHACVRMMVSLMGEPSYRPQHAITLSTLITGIQHGALKSRRHPYIHIHACTSGRTYGCMGAVLWNAHTFADQQAQGFEDKW